MRIDEYEWEPVPGLPERLPDGERMLWQGAPRWTALAWRAFHVRKLAIYFAVLLLAGMLAALWDGRPPLAALASASWLLLLALAGLGVLAALAWLSARTTLYTITSRRVVMRVGIALPISVNIPFTMVEAAALRTCADGTGDIPLSLGSGERIAYLHLWPHVRPWKIRHPQPMLRGVAQPAQVAGILAQALVDFNGVVPACTAATFEAAGARAGGTPRPLLPAAS